MAIVCVNFGRSCSYTEMKLEQQFIIYKKVLHCKVMAKIPIKEYSDRKPILVGKRL